jgi:chemotaxis protein MotB
MPTRRTEPDDESGILLRPGDYPMLKGGRKPPPPEPEPPSIKGPSFKDRLRNVPWKKIAPYAGVGLAGILLGYLLHGGGEDTGPKAKKELAVEQQKVTALQTELTQTKVALDTEKETAAKLAKEKAKLEPKVAEAKALQDKLAAVVGQRGEVTSADGEIRLQLVDKILFRVGEAELTAQGQEVLSTIGTALNDKDIEDKQIWVQGHTDDDPIFVPKPPKAAKGKGAKGKAGKGGGKAAAPPPAPVRFATNWELSAARALTVVHYLQDQVKVDPHRLAAVAFGEWRPASKTKAKNRRIEIVLYPKATVVAPK